ncbi:hypothetical protein [Trinickia dinghuensis]|uniref:hypothetical protein n=1 Tax=Trinickia dinghuensis TaxID=2291023 RepID=UPI0015F17546|nr:hypothetical protein [Trinickia dinghuensis]
MIGMLSGLWAFAPLTGDCGGRTMDAPTSAAGRRAQAASAAHAQMHASAASIAARADIRLIESIESSSSVERDPAGAIRAWRWRPDQHRSSSN